jgi:hypothetical protein
MRYLTIAFFLAIFSGHSQTVSKQVIGPGGQTFENGNNKLSYSVGEAVVGAMTDEDGSIQLGNGYYPSLNLSTLSTEISELQLKVKIYPNPAKEVIYITHPTEQFFEVIITDISGKHILQTALQNTQPLQIRHLAKGTYLLTVTTKSLKQTNTYKIIKR